MRTYADFGIDRDKGDHVVVKVEVYVPWRNEAMRYEHAFDSPGLQEEFRPLPESFDMFGYHHRREMIEKRTKSVEMISNTITRSILHAVGKEK